MYRARLCTDTFLVVASTDEHDDIQVYMLTKDTYKEYSKLYLEEDDPTEYSFIKKYVGTVEDWDTLCNSSWFRPVIGLWRREVDLKIKSKALRALRLVASGDTRDAFIANKYLLDGNWKDTKTKRGRPSKQEIQEEANKMASDTKRIEEDWNRIFQH